MLRLLFILLISQQVFSQQEKQPYDEIPTKYLMSGKIVSTSFHQGGARRPDDLILAQTPKAEFTIYIVLYRGENRKPAMVNRVTTDKEGNFSINLIPGKYGFVLDYKAMEEGQFLPDGYQSMSKHYNESSSWELVGNKPVEITDQDVSNVLLIQNNRSICLDCP